MADERVFVQTALKPGIDDDLIEFFGTFGDEINKSTFVKKALRLYISLRDGQPGIEKAVFDRLAELQAKLDLVVSLVENADPGLNFAQPGQAGPTPMPQVTQPKGDPFTNL